MGLREVLAQLDVKVVGAEQIRTTNAAVDRFVGSLAPGITRLDLLRAKQMEATQVTTQLATALRQLQTAEGASAGEIEEARIALGRASAEAREYGAEITRLEAAQRGAARSAGGESGEGGLLGAWRGMAATLAGAAIAIAGVRRAAATAVDLVRDVVEMGTELGAVSERMGVSARALQEWRFIAERSDVSAGALDSSFQRMTRNLAGNGRIFRELGVQVRDASGHFRSQEAIYGDTITALAGVEDRTRRATLAQQAFGRAGSEMLSIINQGPGAIALLRERFAELGGGLSDDVVQGARDADDAMDDFSLVMTGLRGALVASVLPTITTAITTLASWVAQFVELARTSSLVQTALGALAAVVAAFLLLVSPMLIPLLAIVGAFGLLFIAVEDVVTAFRGGESVFGSIVEWMLAATGHAMTFVGAIDQISVAWQDANATGLEAMASLREALGLADPTLRASATAARQGADQAAYQAGQAERRRIRDLPSTTVAKPDGAVVQTRAGAPRDTGGAKLEAHTSIVVQGNADDDTVRAIDGHMRRRLREAADTIAAPQPEPA